MPCAAPDGTLGLHYNCRPGWISPCCFWAYSWSCPEGASLPTPLPLGVGSACLCTGPISRALHIPETGRAGHHPKAHLCLSSAVPQRGWAYSPCCMSAHGPLASVQGRTAGPSCLHHKHEQDWASPQGPSVPELGAGLKGHAYSLPLLAQLVPLPALQAPA